MAVKLDTDQLKIAVLIHTFPLFSLTFIVDEINELRRLGSKIHLFSIQPPNSKEYPDNYQCFAAETAYLFPINILLLFWRHLCVFFQYPLGYWRTFFYVISRKQLGISGCIKNIIYFAEAIYFYPMLKRSGCQHLHVHFMFGGATIALILNKLCGFPYSMTAHGTDFLVKNYLLSEKIQHANFTRVATQFNAEFLQKIIGEANKNKLFVLPFGIDTEQIKYSPNRSNNQTIKILNVGRLVWQKGQVLLLEACELLIQKGYDFKLEIIGEGELRGQLEQLIVDKSLQNRVKLTGAQSRSKVLEAFLESDIFVFSSVSEGFGIVLLEAMLCGTAIVAPNLNGIPEIILDNQNGKLFETGSVIDLAAKIEELLQDSHLRINLAENARQDVCQRFKKEDKTAALFAKFQLNYH